MRSAANEVRRTLSEASQGHEKVAFYDFDKTLVHTPGPTSGRHIWQEKTGAPWPHEGWWSKKESLDIDVFEMQPIKSVISRLERDKSSGVFTVLLTNRVPTLERQIRRVLDSLGIRLDAYTFATATKAARVMAYGDGASVIDVYDDDVNNLAQVDGVRNRLVGELRLFHVVDGAIRPI